MTLRYSCKCKVIYIQPCGHTKKQKGVKDIEKSNSGVAVFLLMFHCNYVSILHR